MKCPGSSNPGHATAYDNNRRRPHRLLVKIRIEKTYSSRTPTQKKYKSKTNTSSTQIEAKLVQKTSFYQTQTRHVSIRNTTNTTLCTRHLANDNNNPISHISFQTQFSFLNNKKITIIKKIKNKSIEIIYELHTILTPDL